MAKGVWKAKAAQPKARLAEGVALEDGEAEYSLRSLRGRWRDTKGSRYAVAIDPDGTVDIRTTRPNGQVLKTRGLVWLDPKTEWIVWGRSGTRSQYWLTELGRHHLTWEREGSAPFAWERVASPNPQAEAELEEEEEAAEADEEEEAEAPKVAVRRWVRPWKPRVALESTAPASEGRQPRRAEGAHWSEGEDEDTDAAEDGQDDESTPASAAEHEASEAPADTLKRLLGVPARTAPPVVADAKGVRDDIIATATLAVTEASCQRVEAVLAALQAPQEQPGSSPHAAAPMAPVMAQPGVNVPFPGTYVGHLEQVVHTFLGGTWAPPFGQQVPYTPAWPVDPRFVREQLEYYFSEHNLQSDTYLRGFMMPAEGWVPLTLVQSFPRMQALSADIWALRQAGATSSGLEIDGTGMFVRLKDAALRRKWCPTPGAAH